MTYHFSIQERKTMCGLYSDGGILSKIGEQFNCSYSTISKVLIEMLGKEKYVEIAKEHLKESCRKLAKLPKTEKQLENARQMAAHLNTIAARLENGRKMGLNYGRKNLEKWKAEYSEEYKKLCRENGQKNLHFMHESNSKKGNWISNPETLFYITGLSKNFWLKDIIPQYYIKEIKHRVDFAIPSQKLLFEVDGDHWHGYSGDPEMDKERLERDAQVDKWAKDNGWTIFRYNDEKMKKFGII